MIAYLLRRTRRKPLGVIAALVLALCFSAVLCGLRAADEAEVRRYNELYETIPVELTVSNLTGLRTSALRTPQWVVNVFTAEFGVPHTLTDYIKDLRMRCVRKIDSATVDGEPVPLDTIEGITSLAARSKTADVQQSSVVWFDGYDESCLEESAHICLMPLSLYVKLGKPAAVVVNSRFEGNFPDFIPTHDTVSLQIAGTHTDDETYLYCPYSTLSLIYGRLEQAMEADGISATVRDNHQLELVRKEASYWFAEPSPTGESVPWDYSWYAFYPYALIVDDSALVGAWQSLQSSLLVNRACAMLAFVLSGGAGFLVGFLMIRSRKREIALMRTMGTSNFSVFGGYLAEQMLCALLGTILGGAVFLWRPLWKLGVFAVLYLLGLIFALLIFLRKNLMTTAKEE